ncbi:MAG: toxin-antitoxin system HicB family antitoxin [Kiloniellales bacterium]
MLKYPAYVRQMAPDEGFGFVVEVPDLPGCIADGETEQEALENAKAAIEEWIAAAEALGRPTPEPGTHKSYSGKWVQRVPKSLHMKLAAEARREGVSLNSFAMSLLAEGLGKKEAAT